MTLINEREGRPKKLDKVNHAELRRIYPKMCEWVSMSSFNQGDLFGEGGDVRQSGNLHPTGSGLNCHYRIVAVQWFSYEEHFCCKLFDLVPNIIFSVHKAL